MCLNVFNRQLFTKPDGITLLQKGDLLVNPKLGRTLSIIAEHPTAFYSNDSTWGLAKNISDDIQEGGRYSVVDWPIVVTQKQIEHNYWPSFSYYLRSTARR